MKRWPFSKKPPERPVRRRRLTDDEPAPAKTTEEALSKSYSYRRNATIPSVEHSPRLKVHDLRKRQRHYGVWLVTAMAGMLFLVFLLYQLSGSIHVSLYGQVGSASQPREAYGKAISDYLNYRPLERARLFTNLDSMSTYLRSNGLAEVEQVVSVQSDGPGSSHFVLKMRQPVAVWALDGQNYFVDKEGVIFVNNYFDQPTVRISDQSGLSEAMSGQVLTVTSGRFLDFIGQSVGRLEAAGLEVDRVIIPPNTTRMVEIRLKGGMGLRMTVDRPVGEQAEDAVRAVEYAKGEGMRLRYIDIRVSGKAFYRTR